MEQMSLSAGDLRRMHDITRDYDPDGGEVVPWALLHDLEALVPCDNLEASYQDTPSWTIRDQDLPEVADSAACAVTDLADFYRAHYWSSPCSYPDRTGDITSVLRISDLESRLAQRSSAMYCELFLPYGSQHELMVCLDAGAEQRTVRLLFDRGPGLDFSERDVTMLALLRPHLQAAYDAAVRRRQRPSPLTARQRDVLAKVSAGKTDRQVARDLGVAEGTVRRHLEDAYARLGVHSRTEAVDATRTYRVPQSRTPS